MKDAWDLMHRNNGVIVLKLSNINYYDRSDYLWKSII